MYIWVISVMQQLELCNMQNAKKEKENACYMYFWSSLGALTILNVV